MEPTTLLTADYLDIVFDQRNKNYGGYELRRTYNTRLKKAASFALLGVSALLTFSFVSANHHRNEITTRNTVVTAPSDVLIAPPPVVPKIIPPAPPPAPVHIRTDKFTVPVVEVDNKVRPEEIIAKVTGNTQPGPANTDGTDVGLASVTKPGTGTGVITLPKAADGPVAYVPQMPQFNGDMYAYIASHLQYPDAARESGIEGQVLIKFVVNEDGTVSDAIVLRGIGGGCDAEALRMVKSMPKWKPGRQNGVAVKVYFTIPIKFELH